MVQAKSRIPCHVPKPTMAQPARRCRGPAARESRRYSHRDSQSCLRPGCPGCFCQQPPRASWSDSELQLQDLEARYVSPNCETTAPHPRNFTTVSPANVIVLGIVVPTIVNSWPSQRLRLVGRNPPRALVCQFCSTTETCRLPVLK